jgi:TusE/DsrC/DsvC family sulfur relay protein
MHNRCIEVGGKSVALGPDGHLQDPGQWRPEVGRALAESDGIELDDAHWWLIDFVRNHHNRYGNAPLMRMVVAALRQAHGDDTLSSRDVYRLFSDNPIRQACRYGGLPKPDWCI